MVESAELGCACLNPECGCESFHETDVGVDLTQSQPYDVSLFDCRYCGSRWLHYAVADELNLEFVRWYRGPIASRQSRSVTPENAAKILAELPWYFFGGADFESQGEQGSGAELLAVNPVGAATLETAARR